jgi:FecR protein
MTQADQDADPRLSQLIQLARRDLHGSSVLSDEAGFARLSARMEQPPRVAPWAWVAGLTAVAGAGALAAALLFGSTSAEKLSFQVAGGALDAQGRVVGGANTQIRFSDGSEATLERGAEARITNVTDHGADVVLKQGSIHMRVAKKPEAAWKVAAGPYDVKVTGTAFDVSWSDKEQAFDLRMETGAVIVTGPLALSGIVLRAGQHMFGGVKQGRLTVEGGEVATGPTPSAAELAKEPEANLAVPLEPTRESAPQLAPTPSLRPVSDSSSWTKQVAQGHFSEVIAEAEHRGLERTMSNGSLDELAALADAARYSGRASIAKRVLLAERQRFPSSSAARDAAFFLGRLAEETGGGAFEWYERYIQESPRGTYASQAFGRKMMLLYKQRGASAAKPVATEYLARYPKGPYAAAARKIDQESSTATRP